MDLNSNFIDVMIPINLKNYPKHKVREAYESRGRLVAQGNKDKMTFLLDKIEANYGERFYLKCSACKARRYNLYLKTFEHEGIRHVTGVCRVCLNLKYQSQQRTNIDEDYHFFKMVEILAEMGLDEMPDPFTYIDDPVPERPKGMHKKTYNKYSEKYCKHRQSAKDFVRKREEKELDDLYLMLNE